MTDREILLSGMRALRLPEDRADQLLAFSHRVLEVGAHMNLTAIRDPEEAARKHLIDSLTLLPFVGEEDRVLDVGSGAGFPAVPVAVMRPGASVTALDGLAKRMRFITESCELLGIGNVRALHGRAEEFARQADFRERFDLVTARAVAALPVLAEYCIPFVRTGGLFVAMKGPGAEEELRAAKNAIGTLGGRVEEVRSFCLPDSDLSRTLIVIRKISQTATKYPRNAGQIAKKPI